jgi:hypothetical protein
MNDPDSAPAVKAMRHAIASVNIESDATGDNLAIALCTYFEDHLDCPDEEEDDECGWKPWVSRMCDRALDRIAQAAAEAHPRPAASAQEQDAEEMAKHLAEKHGIAYPVELGGLASWILAVVGARNQTIRERDAAQATAERLRAALAWFAGGDLSDAVVCTVTPQGHYETLAPFRDFQLRARAALAASGSEGQPRGLRPLAPEGITDALVIRLTEDPALLEAFACYEGSACGIDEVQGVVRAVLTAAARSAPPTPEGKA